MPKKKWVTPQRVDMLAPINSYLDECFNTKKGLTEFRNSKYYKESFSQKNIELGKNLFCYDIRLKNMTKDELYVVIYASRKELSYCVVENEKLRIALNALK